MNVTAAAPSVRRAGSKVRGQPQSGTRHPDGQTHDPRARKTLENAILKHLS
jgi:hypothetical protein